MLLWASIALACNDRNDDRASPPAASSVPAEFSPPAVSLPPSPSSLPKPDRVAAQLQTAVDTEVRSTSSIPGEILFVRTPELEVAAAAGFADTTAGIRLRPDSGFRIASITKTFTAATVLRLVEDERIGLDDPIVDHLTAESVATLAGDGYQPAAITVRHLLNHTAGLYDYASDGSYQATVLAEPARRWTRAEQVRYAVDHGDPLGPPGAAFHYSDTGYLLLGEIVEHATGQALADAYRTLLRFDRLGLDDTYLETLEPAPPGVSPPAHQYVADIDFGRADPSFDLYGGGGLVSTAEDVASFYEAIFDGTLFDSAGSLDTMLEAPAAAGADDTGMGIFRRRIERLDCWGHSGFWGSDAVHCPEAELTIVRTVNQAVSDELDLSKLERTISLLVLGQPTRQTGGT
jgi:D-alanyl-D-alanine carboxypeptidase